MTKIGQLHTENTIENAMRGIRFWLSKIDISKINIDMRYDPKQNISLCKFSYKGKEYEFRSTKQKNCRLNMHAIAKVMEFKIRAHIMSIEDFGTSMQAYLQLENKSDYVPEQEVYSNNHNYTILGISPLSSNDEIVKKYHQLVKTFHPDMTLSLEAKEEFEKRLAEINSAYAEIKKERRIN